MWRGWNYLSMPKKVKLLTRFTDDVLMGFRLRGRGFYSFFSPRRLIYIHGMFASNLLEYVVLKSVWLLKRWFIADWLGHVREALIVKRILRKFGDGGEAVNRFGVYYFDRWRYTLSRRKQIRVMLCMTTKVLRRCINWKKKTYCTLVKENIWCWNGCFLTI